MLRHAMAARRSPGKSGSRSSPLCYCSHIQRVAVGLACVLLPAIVGAGRSLLLEDNEAPEAIPDCDDGVLEFLSGSKVHVPVIPYSAECIKLYHGRGSPLKSPHTVGLHLKGLPKTGTTWTEMVITELLERICASHIYSWCRHEHIYDPGHNRQLHLTIPSQQEQQGKRAAVIRFTVQYKHSLTYNWTCDHLSSKETFKDDCYVLNIDRLRNPVRNPEHSAVHGEKGMEWKECVYEGPYSRISECIPEYMHVAEYPWGTDVGMMELLRAAMMKGYYVSLAGAQRKYIVTLRDPRDSAISNAHFVSGRNGADPNEYIVNGGCKDYITALALFHYWQVEVQGKVYPTLPIWYRDAVDDPAGEVYKILEFIGLRATQDIVDEVLRQTSADAMREKEDKDELVGANRDASSGRKTRKAHYNTYMEELNSTATELCNADMRRVLSEPMLKKLGFTDK